MKFIVFFLVFLVHGLLAIPNDLIFSKNLEYQDVVMCIGDIASSLKSDPTIVIVDFKNETEIVSNEFKHELVVVIQKKNLPFATADIKDLNAVKNVLKNNVLVVVHLQNCTVASDIDLTIVFEEWKYLFVITDDSCDCYSIINKVAQFLDEFDVTFMIHNSTEKNSAIVTYISEVDETTCKLSNDVKPTIVNACISGSLKTNEAFPNKIPRNYNKCPLKVGVSEMHPYAFLGGRVDDLTPLDDVIGSDVEIMKIIADYLNTTLKLYYVHKEPSNPFVHTDYLKYLINGSIDVCIGGHYNFFGDAVDYSGIYNLQDVIWIYAVQREDRSWKTLISKVQIQRLYIFVIFYLCYSVAWWVISKYDGINVSLVNTLFYGWGALIGCASLIEPRSFKQKLLNCVYLYMCIHLSAYISVQLYSFLTILAPPHLLKYSEDVMISGRTAFLNNLTKYFIDDPKYISFAQKSDHCTTFEDCAEKALEHNGMTLIAGGYLFGLQAASAVNYEARLLRTTERFLLTYHEMLLRKDVPILGYFQKVLLRLFEAGICDHLHDEAIGLTLLSKAKSAVDNMMVNSYSCQEGCAITISQTAGAFYLLLMGSALSFIVFVIEIVFARKIGSFL